MNAKEGKLISELLETMHPFVRYTYEFTQVVNFLKDFGEIGPYKVGDRVELTVNPNCPGGWSGSEHFLVKGAKATVVELNWFTPDPNYKSGWVVGLVFDDESWIPSAHFPDSGHKKGVPIPVAPTNRHSFWFEVKNIKPAEPVEDRPDFIDMDQFDMGRF
jgi:hypothetical protein